ncbi:hypothetical protein KIPB_000642 [Kipferlia bialata]|uniref:Uncharacterized protein n=1 Tax=Kipferlia bialata TaxID=797122 RepID=A0A9K3GF66_9EUKA|nr:hypothetical protein KIPB_000642 [Kipferlia bialata]|eukprot:g642.t1
MPSLQTLRLQSANGVTYPCLEAIGTLIESRPFTLERLSLDSCVVYDDGSPNEDTETSIIARQRLLSSLSTCTEVTDLNLDDFLCSMSDWGAVGTALLSLRGVHTLTLGINESYVRNAYQEEFTAITGYEGSPEGFSSDDEDSSNREDTDAETTRLEQFADSVCHIRSLSAGVASLQGLRTITLKLPALSIWSRTPVTSMTLCLVMQSLQHLPILETIDLTGMYFEPERQCFQADDRWQILPELLLGPNGMVVEEAEGETQTGTDKLVDLLVSNTVERARVWKERRDAERKEERDNYAKSREENERKRESEALAVLETVGTFWDGLEGDSGEESEGGGVETVTESGEGRQVRVTGGIDSEVPEPPRESICAHEDAEGTTSVDTGLPVIVVSATGNSPASSVPVDDAGTVPCPVIEAEGENGEIVTTANTNGAEASPDREEDAVKSQDAEAAVVPDPMVLPPLLTRLTLDNIRMSPCVFGQVLAGVARPGSRVEDLSMATCLFTSDHCAQMSRLSNAQSLSTLCMSENSFGEEARSFLPVFSTLPNLEYVDLNACKIPREVRQEAKELRRQVTRERDIQRGDEESGSHYEDTDNLVCWEFGYSDTDTDTDTSHYDEDTWGNTDPETTTTSDDETDTDTESDSSTSSLGLGWGTTSDDPDPASDDGGGDSDSDMSEGMLLALAQVAEMEARERREREGQDNGG